jgi:hypothetical protein
MSKFLGNVHGSVMDCNELVQSLAKTDGYWEEDYMCDSNGNIKEEFQGVHRDHIQKWLAAGYPDPICKGAIYFPHYHFDEKFIYALDNFFGTVCNKCFISEIRPGMIVPPHQDLDMREQQLLKLGDLMAFHVHLGEPEEGHVFMNEGHAHYMEANGNAYQWDSYESWHSGSNTGFTNKYFLTYRGTRLKYPTDFTYKWYDYIETVGIVIDGKEY